MEQAINFWQLINSDISIVIPAIQRDYAQGRIGKEFLRRNFLLALKSAILNEEKLTMDFVYGVHQEVRFIPLDGQQRLTTLWLLHWYIAYKAGILEQVKNVLARFSYETRLSSSQFCEDLCTLRPQLVVKDKEDAKIIPLRKWIVQQTWYYHHYQQNPTVQAMLNMICGTDIQENDVDISDGIDEVFSDINYKDAWERLILTDCVSFYKLKIKLEDGDELYIKMNARGRQLSDFENFKAELIEHITHIMGETYATTFAGKMDVDWTDIFWYNRYENKYGDANIDDIYFTFIRRYIYNECIRRFDEPEVKQKMPLIASDYTSFDIYQEILDEATIKRLASAFDNIRGVKIQASCAWEEFDYIPTYISEHSVSPITEKQRLIFYALCKYFELGKYENQSFNDWKRVVWNICENRVGDLKGAAMLFDLLAPHSHNIIDYLCQGNVAWPNNKEQMLEEQSKAKYINCYPDIIQAESYAFFKGAIRFLFTDNKGVEDWSGFQRKFENAKKYFDAKGVRPEYKADSKLLRRYIVLLKDKWSISYDDNSSSWRDRLLEKGFAEQNHMILSNDDILSYDYCNFVSAHKDIKKKYAKEFMVRNNIFTNAVSGCRAKLDSPFCHGSVTLHPYNAKASWKYYVLNPRTEWLFSDELDITFRDSNLEKCRKIKLMFGTHVLFKYKNHMFEWYAIHKSGEADIYIKSNDWNDYPVRAGMDKADSDLKKYFCFCINAFTSTKEEFQKQMDDLIVEYDNREKE